MGRTVAAALCLSSTVVAAAPLTTAEVQPLLDANACSSCHSRTHMVVGPAFDDVAKKYKDDPDAATRLAKKVRSGGSGVWGQVGMPANTKISDADLARVIDWVLHGGAGGSQ